MEIAIQLYWKELTRFTAELDIDKASEITDSIWNDEFAKLFAANCMIAMQKEETEEAQTIVNLIKLIASQKADEFETKKWSKITQLEFNNILDTLLVTDVQFIPLP